LFGFSFKPPVRPTFASVIETLRKVDIPICSVDIPSGKVDTLDLISDKHACLDKPLTRLIR
jgi:NAD(P)H-hydrate repair Nnr-like enzyme with NAD(P)H-hydrate epimerase domain